MDDPVSFFEFRVLDTLRRFIECVTTVFTQHSFQVNVGKLEVCAVVAGPGTQAPVAQLKRGQLRIHPRGAQGRPHELVLKESAKYLGSILHVGVNNKEELRNRVTKANTVHGGLTPGVWRSYSIPLSLKIRLWQTLVQTKGLYAVETRVLGRADVLYLERWQIKKLRHLARSPVHITRETSEALHRRVQIPTIESQLRVRRLKWWRQLLAPRFAATTRDRIQQGHTWDAATNILHLLANAHVRSSGYASASDEADAAATEDHATNQRSGDRPRQAHITARTRASEPSSERECRTSGVRVSPDDAETRSHGQKGKQREPTRGTSTLDTLKGTDQMLSSAEFSTGWQKLCGRTNRLSTNAYRRKRWSQQL